MAGQQGPAPALEVGQPFNPFGLFTGIFIPDALVRSTIISPGAKLVYGRLARYAGQDGRCYPAVETQEAVRQILAAAAMRLLRRRVAGSVTVARGVRQAVKRNSRRCTQMHGDKKACHGSGAAVGLICGHLRASAAQFSCICGLIASNSKFITLPRTTKHR